MDDTTRRVGTDEFGGHGDELRGRGEEQVRDYAATTPSTAASSGATRSTGSGDADLDDESSRRARELENEIAETRAEMSETIEAIQEKLRPANLMSEATEKVKSATTEKVKNMTDTASETAQDMMRGGREHASSLIEGAKQNPIPALMIGAGVAWLLMGKRDKNSGYRGSSTWSQNSMRNTGTGYSGGAEYGRSNEADYSDVDRQSGSGYASNAQYTGSGRYGEGRAYGYGSEGTGGVSSALSGAGDTARQTVRKTSNQLQRMLHDNPLLVGAAAILAGAAIGASLPETERENQLMGEARDSVVERAQEVAQDAKNTVKEVASDPVAIVSKVAEAVSDKK